MGEYGELSCVANVEAYHSSRGSSAIACITVLAEERSLLIDTALQAATVSLFLQIILNITKLIHGEMGPSEPSYLGN